MPEVKLGRLEKVKLRDVWIGESTDFTPWLATEENLALLGETIGIDLELEAQEKDVGPFRADILCKNSIDGSWVLIENQLERTDHTHLGQLLTYAAGLDAAVIIWIAEQFTDEHRAALDWINEITSENFLFFGLEIELWRIDGPTIAPKFNVVSKPNEWSSIVRTNKDSGEISDYKQKQLQFWIGYKNYIEQNSIIRCPKPAPQAWMNHPIGTTGCYLTSIISSTGKNQMIRVDFIMDGLESKEYFKKIFEEKEEIEREIGAPLTWYSKDDVRMCRVYLSSPDDFLKEGEWKRQYEWLKNNLELFYRVFKPRIQRIKTGMH
jgi:hypothetical protein